MIKVNLHFRFSLCRQFLDRVGMLEFGLEHLAEEAGDQIVKITEDEAKNWFPTQKTELIFELAH